MASNVEDLLCVDLTIFQGNYTKKLAFAGFDTSTRIKRNALPDDIGPSEVFFFGKFIKDVHKLLSCPQLYSF